MLRLSGSEAVARLEEKLDRKGLVNQSGYSRQIGCLGET
jgi:hypothetical protein